MWGLGFECWQCTQQLLVYNYNRREETLFPLALQLSFTNLKIVELQPHSIVITMNSGKTVITNKEGGEKNGIDHLEHMGGYDNSI